MRVKIAANSPLPPVRAWLPLGHAPTSTVFSFKSLLCTSLVAFYGISPSLLRLSVDGFELLDDCELTVVRDGDLISVDVRKALHEDATAPPRHTQTVDGHTSHATRTRSEPDGPLPSRKRKRRTPTPSPSGFKSDTESSTDTTTTESTTSGESGSESDSASPETSESGPTSDAHEALVASMRKATSVGVAVAVTPSIHPKPFPSMYVPPGYGKPQTRARNLRRRLKRKYEREADDASEVPVSGANAAVLPVQAVSDPGHGVPPLMSLSLRNKNKAKNFRSLMRKPLPTKIIFGEQEGVATNGETNRRQGLPRPIPPSLRPSLPPNVLVTSVDVEAEMNDEYGEEEEEQEAGGLESKAGEQWATLAKATRDNVTVGVFVGYKALGIDPLTCTPGHVLTVALVESRDDLGVAVRPVQDAVSISGSAIAEAEQFPWEEIESGDWRRL